jgi:hypothetical protein
MNTLEALEKFSLLCDELASSQQAENTLLRSRPLSGTTAESAVSRQKEISARLDGMLAEVRQANPSGAAERSKARALRDRVMQKILKLMLLSRESEQLLLRSTSVPAAAAPKPSIHRVADVYRANSK